MKAVMYHYVREFDSSLPYFKFLDVNNFRKQLNFFDKNYGFVTKEEWDSFTLFGKMPNVSGKVILTFDDAMSCHYEYVFHELKERGLWGIFYVPTLPYSKSKLLDVHRIHLLCGAFDGVSLLKEAMSLLSEDMILDSKRREFRDETYKNQINNSGVIEFKRLLNYYISYDFRESFIDNIGKIFNYNFNPKKFYISKVNLKEMSDCGMIIGSHTVNHPVMSKLSKLEQFNEIDASFNTLTKIGVCKKKTYSHPYGGFLSFDSNTVSLLNEHHVLYSFNVEYREIEANDFTKSKQFLPRFDCNLFDYGQVS
jgi:peptidoglycan/xylan/chitin deacetylase (PgdA/CDA1 family)